MDLEKLKQDQREKIEANNQEIEKLNASKVMIRLNELESDNLQRIEELHYLERLELIPGIDAMLDKVKLPEKVTPLPVTEKPPKDPDERV